MVAPLPDVPGFVITALRGRGGMGRVYQCHCSKHGAVALKLLDSRSDDGTYRRRLAHELPIALCRLRLARREGDSREMVVRTSRTCRWATVSGHRVSGDYRQVLLIFLPKAPSDIRTDFATATLKGETVDTDIR